MAVLSLWKLWKIHWHIFVWYLLGNKTSCTHITCVSAEWEKEQWGQAGGTKFESGTFNSNLVSEATIIITSLHLTCSCAATCLQCWGSFVLFARCCSVCFKECDSRGEFLWKWICPCWDNYTNWLNNSTLTAKFKSVHPRVEVEICAKCKESPCSSSTEITFRRRGWTYRWSAGKLENKMPPATAFASTEA